MFILKYESMKTLVKIVFRHVEINDQFNVRVRVCHCLMFIHLNVIIDFQRDKHNAASVC